MKKKFDKQAEQSRLQGLYVRGVPGYRQCANCGKVYRYFAEDPHLCAPFDLCPDCEEEF